MNAIGSYKFRWRRNQEGSKEGKSEKQKLAKKRTNITKKTVLYLIPFLAKPLQCIHPSCKTDADGGRDTPSAAREGRRDKMAH
jgi:hypothetical protein